MKKILLLHHSENGKNLQKARTFARNVNELLGEGVLVDFADVAHIFFDISNDAARVYNCKTGSDLLNYDLIIFRYVGKYMETAGAIAKYCEKMGIKYTDSYLKLVTLGGKLNATILHWSNGLPVPRTLFGSAKEMTARLPELGREAVLKDNHGAKGDLNFIVKSGNDITSITTDHSDRDFILQEFIPNDGDLRFLVFDFKPVMIIKRKGDGSSHLNNTSKGGAATMLDIESMDRRIIDMAVAASRIEQLEVAGVDVIFDKVTGLPYILEVNQAPQISSGSFVHEKTERYAKMIEEMLK